MTWPLNFAIVIHPIRLPELEASDPFLGQADIGQNPLAFALPVEEILERSTDVVPQRLKVRGPTFFVVMDYTTVRNLIKTNKAETLLGFIMDFKLAEIQIDPFPPDHTRQHRRCVQIPLAEQRLLREYTLTASLVRRVIRAAFVTQRAFLEGGAIMDHLVPRPVERILATQVDSLAGLERFALLRLRMLVFLHELMPL
jgi:hypothetical protein